jgi:hypothetical protein
MSINRQWLAAATTLAFATAAGAVETPDLLPFAVMGGTPTLDLRLRAEHADNESLAQTEDANATTLRARLGFTTGKWNDFDLGFEYEGVTAYDKLDYNNSTPTTSETARPVIADPAGSEMNQAWVRYAGIPRTTLQGGRQRLVLDNQRFVGNVGWRQNEQTYDGALLVTRPLAGTELTYAYFHNVNSVAFTNFPARTHLINASYSPGPWLKVTAYDYALDFATIVGNRQDSQTLGLRLAGAPALNEAETVKLLYAAEYAHQDEHADAPGTVKADYVLGELGAGVGPATLKLGYEVMGSNNGVYALQTPLATLHAFDGWADVFLTTPAAGLVDSYASLGATLAGVALTAAYHEFTAEFGGADHGTEVDASAGYAFNRQLAALVKYASYDADAFATDTDKGWLQLEYKF